jgi:GT2 family glycosyltransferase
MVEVSVVVPTLKERDRIECIPCLERSDFTDYEVIVRDDSSATKARNEGIKRANSNKIVFLDDDSRPREGYLAEASRVLDREAAVAGRIVHPSDDVFSAQYTSHYSYGDEPKYINRFWGPNMAVRREVFDEVGTFDENIFWGHEEKELADRVCTEYRIYYDPNLVVEHDYAESILDFWVKQYRLELETPYYWDTRRIPTSEQWKMIVFSLLSPHKYVRRTISYTIVQTGNNIAQTIGRLRGMARKASDSEP